MSFMDYVATSPKEELKNAFFRTGSDGLEKFGSLNGRKICLQKIVFHTSCIILKPLFYIFIGAISILVTNAHSKGKLKGSLVETARFRVLENNPELVKRSYSMYKNMILCGPVAIISQIIQVIKAVAGILHPGFYFKKDSLTPLMHRLAAVARSVGCQDSLIQELDKGSKAISTGGNNGAFIKVMYTRYLNIIATKLEDPSIPNAQKLNALSLLNMDEDTDISGIKGCIAGLGRTLQDMCAMLSVPDNPTEVVPFLIEKLKKDIMTQMIMSAEYAHKEPALWKDTINKIGWDQAHRGTALTSILGSGNGLSAEVLTMAKQDPFLSSKIQLTNNEKQALENEFNKRLEQQKIPYLISAINSVITEDSQGRVDFLPGLKAFREQVIQALSNSVTETELNSAKLSEGDEAVFVERNYQRNNGSGDRSERGFNDLNEKAIQFLLDNPTCFATV